MLKYVESLVSFQEVPNEISLCINISGCKNACKGCHSPHLAEDIGEELTIEELSKLIMKNKGITCVCLLGGDNNPKQINILASMIKTLYHIKVAWYSGKQELAPEIDINKFDFIKLGPYIEEFGPLNSRTTNQKFYTVIDNELYDITYKFWK